MSLLAAEKKFITATHCSIPIGTDVQCVFANNTKLTLRFVGYEEDSFLLFRFPIITGIAAYLAPNTPISALFTTSGFNVAFKSTLSLALPKQRLGFFHYPDRFRLYEIRSGKRFDCLIPAAVMLEKKYVGVLQDISLMGCRLTFDAITGTPLRNFAQGQRIKVEVWAPNETFNIGATVMRISKNFSRITLGLSFGDLAKDDTQNLEAFLHSLQFSGLTNEQSSTSL